MGRIGTKHNKGLLHETGGCRISDVETKCYAYLSAWAYFKTAGIVKQSTRAVFMFKNVCVQVYFCAKWKRGRHLENSKFATRAFSSKRILVESGLFLLFANSGEEQKRGRQVAEGFWGHGNKNAAGSCTFHSWLMSQWDDASYQHSAHGIHRRKLCRG